MAYITERTVEARVKMVRHGFKEMQTIAQDIVAHNTPKDSLMVAEELFGSNVYQVRMVGVFVLGYIAHQLQEAVTLLRQKVSLDTSWQVQEILAQAFNQYCRDKGYEYSLPDIEAWLLDDNPNVKRAVTEGLRIWNTRDYFKLHPDIAIKLLGKWKDHESDYLRRSVGNALRDISRTEKALVGQELATWDVTNPNILFTYKLASKFL